MSAVEQLPEFPHPVIEKTRVRYRYLFNFCTQNYSCSFWEFSDWKRVIDFMVLNEVNMTFAILGQEKAWYEILKKMDFSEEEILSFISGPAFNA